jgi:NADH:ubiquinone oxidoreductase subunit 2 (subunit N)
LSLVSSGFLITSLVIVIVSSITCFYYIRLVKMFFFVSFSKNSFWVSSKKTLFLDFAISLSFFFNIFFILNPEIFSLISAIICSAIL